MKVTDYDLASFIPDTQAWETDPGNYTLHFASDAEQINAKTSYKVNKALSVPANDVLAPEV